MNEEQMAKLRAMLAELQQLCDKINDAAENAEKIKAELSAALGQPGTSQGIGQRNQ
jgi:hypothetical protein